MKKKTKRKILYALSTFLSALSSPGAYAKIPPTAFKGVTKCFKEGKEFLSPTLGEAALDSGLIYNLRFYGNFDAKMSEEGRQYKDDESQDPLWKMVKILFPSTGGQLSTESNHPMAFGRLMNKTDAVSLLLNFVDKVREEIQKKNPDENQIKELEKNLRNALLEEISDEMIPKARDSLEKMRKTKDNIKKFFSDESFNDPKSMSKVRSNFSKTFKDILGGKSIEEIGNEIHSIFSETASEGRKSKIKSLEEKTNLLIENYYNEKNKRLRKDFIEKAKEITLDPLIKAIEDTLNSEGTSIYPTYTTEQVILAFFCHKFNTQEDIWHLMEQLDDSIVERAKVEEKLKAARNKEDLTLKENDLEEEIVKHNAYDLDDVLALEMADIWTMETPYRPGSLLISNGSARPYDRNNDRSQVAEFADCAETTLRHLMNILLYNPLTRDWDLTYIEKYVQEHAPGNTYFENFKKFYERQMPTYANDGTPVMRSLFNRVVGDLNSNPKDLMEDSSIPIIRYSQNNNELEPGFINLMHVFQRLFGLKPDPLPQEFTKKCEWVEKALQNLFEALNPKRLFYIDTSQLEEKKDEIEGELSITILDKENSVSLFSFLLSVNANKHAELSLESMEASKAGERYREAFDKKRVKITKDTAEESLWLLSIDTVLKEKKINQPLYHLFNTPLVDDNSRIHFLKTLCKIYPKGGIEEKIPPQLKGMLKNVLEDIAWSDRETVSRASPSIFALADKEVFKDIIFESVAGLYVGAEGEEGKEHADNFFKIAQELKNLQYLSLHYRPSGGEIKFHDFENLKSLKLGFSFVAGSRKFSFRKLPNLKSLDLEGVPAEEITLEALPNLEKIDLKYVKKLKKISLQEFISLKSLNLSYSSVREIEGLETLTNLERLDLSGTGDLFDKIYSNASKSLKELFLNGTLVKKMTLENLSNLEKLDLKKTGDLGEISLQNLTNLKYLDLDSSSVEKIALENLPNLEELDLTNTRKLKKLSLKNLADLKSLQLYLYESAVENFELDTLPNLEELKFGFTYKPVNISLKNLTNLKSLSFATYSSVQHLVLKNLTNLSELDLRQCSNLKTISFEGDFSTLTTVKLAKDNNIERLEGIECSWNQNIIAFSGVSSKTEIRDIGLDNEKLGLHS